MKIKKKKRKKEKKNKNGKLKQKPFKTHARKNRKKKWPETQVENRMKKTGTLVR